MISITILPVFFVIQLLCFQTDVTEAMGRKVGPGPGACEFEEGDKQVYRCCSGFYANDSKCIVCSKDTYGYGCRKICHCKSYERCYHDSGCGCPVGKWGDKCQNICQCFTRDKCRRDSGKCQCQHGWIGDKCTDCDKNISYSDGKNFCIQSGRCLHCFNGPYCNVNILGNCHCTPGWTGNKCNVSIPVHCSSYSDNDICRNHSDCGDFHLCNLNTCKCDWCAPGYRGEHCNLPCENGKYGYDCNYSCFDVCGSEQCHHITGDCITCPIGYHGENCDKMCPTDYYGYNCQGKCQCSEKMICEHQVGCTYGDECTTSMPYNTSTTQKSEVTVPGQSNHTDRVTNSYHSTTKQINGLENRIRGDLEDTADNPQLIIGNGVFLVLLIIVNVIVCVVCHRKRKITINKRYIDDTITNSRIQRESLEMTVEKNLTAVQTDGQQILEVTNGQQCHYESLSKSVTQLYQPLVRESDQQRDNAQTSGQQIPEVTETNNGQQRHYEPLSNSVTHVYQPLVRESDQLRENGDDDENDAYMEIT